MIEKLKRLYRFLFRNPPKFKITSHQKIERHGSVYGGWNIIANSLKKESVVYSFGIGKDISFDLSIIEQYCCNLYAFDPTPEVIGWLKNKQLPQQFKFNPMAIADHDGSLTFYTPEIEGHISHTEVPSEKSKAVEVACKKISTITKELGSSQIDLLKMDVEGFEYDILRNMIEEKIIPKQLLVEFHHFFASRSNADTEQTIAFLEKNGYRLFNVSDSFCEYSFVYENKKS